MRRTYRDPQLLRYQAALGAGVVAISATFAVLLWPHVRALALLAVIPVFVVLAGRASRQGVRTDEDGITVRDEWNEETRLRWEEIDSFLVLPGEEPPLALARLRDGEAVVLAPLGGASAQTRSHRQRWAEQSVDSLNAQLRHARNSAPLGPAR